MKSSSSELTIAFTTIDRDESCKHAVTYLRSVFPESTLLVVEQNNPSYEMKRFYRENGVTVCYVGVDAGLSSARNKIMELVQTKYVLLCDDDIYRLDSGEVFKSLDFMERRGDVLAVGGRASKIELHDDQSIERVNPDFDYKMIPSLERGYLVLQSVHMFDLQKYTRIEDGFYESDVVENFVLFDVPKLKRVNVGWDENIKIKNEHLDFYLSLKTCEDASDCKVVYNPFMIAAEIDGLGDNGPIDYKVKRTRNDFTAIYCNKWGLEREFHVGKWINVFDGYRYRTIPWSERNKYANEELERYKLIGEETRERYEEYPVDASRITFLATTMERYQVAESFVLSVRRFFPEAKVVLGVQASHFGEELDRIEKDYDVRVVRLPKDHGLSRSRNDLLEYVSTDYFVLCDDDFVIDEDFFLGNAYRVLEENPVIGVVGGYYRDVIYDRKLQFRNRMDRQFTMFFHVEEKTRSLIRVPFNYLSIERVFDEETRCVKVDCVNNLALFRTAIFTDGSVRWDDRMKISGEHIDFYFNLFQRGDVGVVYDPSFSVLHNRRQNVQYAKYRDRRDGINIFYDKWGIDNEIDFDFGYKKVASGVTQWVKF